VGERVTATRCAAGLRLRPGRGSRAVLLSPKHRQPGRAPDGSGSATGQTFGSSVEQLRRGSLSI